MKKVSLLVSLLMLVSFANSASAETMRESMNRIYSSSVMELNDIMPGHANYNAIAFLVEEEVIAGYPDGSFKADGKINRAEILKMIVAFMYPEMKDMDMGSYKNCFPDVKTDWYAPYVCYGKSVGWISGYEDGTFRPGNSVTRAEAMKIVFNVMVDSSIWPDPTDFEFEMPMPSDTGENAWFAGYLRFAIAKELLDGQHVTGTQERFFYKPNEAMTRKEVAEMIWRTYIYNMERIEYAELISATACFQMENPDLSEEESKAKWVDEILAPMGYTEESADELSYKYVEDSVLTELKADLIADSCGDGAEAGMETKWRGFLRYAR